MATNFPRVGQRGWHGHGAHHRLLSSPVVSLVPLLFSWGQKMKMQAMCRCLWHSLVLKTWEYSCAAWAWCQGHAEEADGCCWKFFNYLRELTWSSCPFPLRKVQKENVFAYFKEVRRWRGGVRCLQKYQWMFLHSEVEKNKENSSLFLCNLPCFQYVSFISATFKNKVFPGKRD